MGRNAFYLTVITFSSVLFGGCASTAYKVQLEAGQGAAAPGNTQPANFLAAVTDACIDWNTTEQLLREIAATVGPALAGRNRIAQSA